MWSSHPDKTEKSGLEGLISRSTATKEVLGDRVLETDDVRTPGGDPGDEGRREVYAG